MRTLNLTITQNQNEDHNQEYYPFNEWNPINQIHLINLQKKGNVGKDVWVMHEQRSTGR